MSKVALLAPVPEEHLLEGLKTTAEHGKVAFGSRAWQVFQKLDELRQGEAVDAYLYASHSSKFGPPKVRWRARYIGQEPARGGKHPAGMKYRPASTEKYGTDNQGFWAVFWEVEALEELGKDEAIPMSHFSGFESKKPYVPVFVPEGPILIDPL